MLAWCPPKPTTCRGSPANVTSFCRLASSLNLGLTYIYNLYHCQARITVFSSEVMDWSRNKQSSWDTNKMRKGNPYNWLSLIVFLFRACSTLNGITIVVNDFVLYIALSSVLESIATWLVLSQWMQPLLIPYIFNRIASPSPLPCLALLRHNTTSTTWGPSIHDNVYIHARYYYTALQAVQILLLLFCIRSWHDHAVCSFDKELEGRMVKQWWRGQASERALWTTSIQLTLF